MKPLGRKSYGSIGHLPNSRLGPSDSCVTDGQYRICCEKSRDSKDIIIVQEKLDGSNVAVALKDDVIYPLTRAGYVANTSPYEQHHLFYDWVIAREKFFRSVLNDGERLCGEWLAQAHGTLYNLENRSPFAVFDLFAASNKRLPFVDVEERLFAVDPDEEIVGSPRLLHIGGALSVEDAMGIHSRLHYGTDEIEGVVYRVERNEEVDFLAKYVRPDKIDGKYLESVTGKAAIWNWRDA